MKRRKPPRKKFVVIWNPSPMIQLIVWSLPVERGEPVETIADAARIVRRDLPAKVLERYVIVAEDGTRYHLSEEIGERVA